MKNLAKGALLNAFVFPGTGQLAQKRYLRGWMYIAAVLACLVVLIRVIIATVRSMFANSANGLPSSDVTVLGEQVRTELLQNGGALANYALLAFILVWVIALVDAIVTGISMDRLPGDNTTKH